MACERNFLNGVSLGIDDIRYAMSVMVTNNFSHSLTKSYGDKIKRMDENVVMLFERDYTCMFIHNKAGALCDHYPPTIIIPTNQRDASSTASNSRSTFNNTDSLLLAQEKHLQNIFENSRKARCRSRFIVPCIFVRDRYICRSSTLSNSVELRANQVVNFASKSKGYITRTASSPSKLFTAASSEDLRRSTEIQCESSVLDSGLNTKEMFDRLRGFDTDLLHMLHIQYICDLMLENRKVKFWLKVTSSEKADRYRRYEQFNLLTMPYPGCEFFKVWRDSGYKMSALYFNWNSSESDAPLKIELLRSPRMATDIQWTLYRGWDLVLLTTNYLRLLLGLIADDTGGILIHCISGWDRTPLFVSLLRCLLWSEGLVHTSLQPVEMLYLTLVYDWFLFGHQLKTRLAVGEEILKFCFHYLEHIALNEPSLCLANLNPMSNFCQDARVSRLLTLCELFQQSYTQATTHRNAVRPPSGSATATFNSPPQIQNLVNLFSDFFTSPAATAAPTSEPSPATSVFYAPPRPPLS